MRSTNIAGILAAALLALGCNRPGTPPTTSGGGRGSSGAPAPKRVTTVFGIDPFQGEEAVRLEKFADEPRCYEESVFSIPTELQYDGFTFEQRRCESLRDGGDRTYYYHSYLKDRRTPPVNGRLAQIRGAFLGLLTASPEKAKSFLEAFAAQYGTMVKVPGGADVRVQVCMPDGSTCDDGTFHLEPSPVYGMVITFQNDTVLRTAVQTARAADQRAGASLVR